MASDAEHLFIFLGPLHVLIGEVSVQVFCPFFNWLHQKTTWPIKWICKIAGHKVNTQKLKAFLYTSNEISQTETRKKVPFTIATRKIKYQGINLTKEVKDLNSENYRTLKEEIKEDTNKWKHVPCSWIGRINITKMLILPKAIYRFNAIPIKIPMAYCTDLEQIFQKIVWNYK